MSNWSKEWKAPVVPQRFLDQANKEEQDIVELYGKEVNPHLLGVKEREQFIAGVRKIGTFRIKDGQSHHTFVGEVVGDLTLDYSDDGWNIYHVPTLTKFTKAVPGYEPDIYIERIEPHEVKFEGVNTRWITKEEVEKLYPSNNKEQLSYEYEKDQLLRWMAKVQDVTLFQWPDNDEITIMKAWAELSLLTPTDYENKAVMAKEIIKEWCLSVPVTLMEE